MAEGRETLRRTAGLPARFREENDPTTTRKAKKISFLPSRKSLKSQKTARSIPQTSQRSTQRTQRRGFFPKTQKSRRGLTSILNYIYGDEFMDILASHKLKPRETLEHILPDEQCNAIIGPIVYDTKKGKSAQTPEATKCWLCGLTLIKDEGLKPECEHILPIAEAAMFLELYEKKGITKLMREEYHWSHRICNREKLAMFPLSVYDDKFVINDSLIKDVLRKIFNSRMPHADNLKKRILEKYRSKENFIKVRTDAMKLVYKRIIDAITHQAKGARLTLLAAASRLHNARENGPLKLPATAAALPLIAASRAAGTLWDPAKYESLMETNESESGKGALALTEIKSKRNHHTSAKHRDASESDEENSV